MYLLTIYLSLIASTCAAPLPAAMKAGMGDSVPSTMEGKGLRPEHIAIPLTALAYGCLKPLTPVIGRLDNRVWDRLSATASGNGYSPETLLQWTPIASVYLMDAAGLPLRHRFRQHLALDIGSLALAGGAGWVMRRISEGIPTFGLKPGTQFPSGHATNAFRAAEMFRQEWKLRSPWVGWSGYVIAGCVSYLRMRHGQHQLSEVLAGAGLGVLSTRSVYWLKDRIERRRIGN